MAALHPTGNNIGIDHVADLQFVEKIDAYIKEHDKIFYDMIAKAKVELTFQNVINVAKANWEDMHADLEHEIRDMLRRRGFTEEEVAKLRFDTGTGEGEPEAKKQRVEMAPKEWTPDRISSYIDCIKRPDPIPHDVQINMDDKANHSTVATSLETIKRGQIVKVKDEASSDAIQVPYGVAVTKVVKDILDRVTKNVRNATKDYLAVVGPSGTGKSTGAQVAEQYCRAENIFHVYLDDASILTAELEAQTILRSMTLFNSEECWKKYEIEDDVYGLAKMFVKNEQYPTRQALLDHIMTKLRFVQIEKRKPVVCIIDNCQGIWKQEDVREKLKKGGSGKRNVRGIRHLQYITPNSPLQGGCCVTVALASQHAKFEEIMDRAQLNDHELKARIPMDPIDVVALKTVLHRVQFHGLTENQKWYCASKALAASGCVPRHAYEHLTKAKKVWLPLPKILEPEGEVLESIKDNVKRYLEGQSDLWQGDTGKQQWDSKMATQYQSILGGNDVYSSHDLRSNSAIDYGILTPVTESNSFRYISQLHKRAHMFYLSLLGTGSELVITTAYDLEKHLINRIFAMGITLSEGFFGTKQKCNLPTIARSESSMDLLYDSKRKVYYMSKGDQAYFKRLMCKVSQWTVMIYCPKNYVSTDVFLLNRNGNEVTLYSVQITKDKNVANVTSKYNGIEKSVTDLIKALVGQEDVAVDMVGWKKAATLEVPFRAETRYQGGTKDLKVVCILISPIEHSEIKNNILENNMVYFCGPTLIENAFFVKLKFNKDA